MRRRTDPVDGPGTLTGWSAYRSRRQRRCILSGAVTSGNAPSELLGRDEPRRRLAGVISNARNGIGGSLVIRGDPGVGKTALLQDALSASRLEAVQLSGFEAEATVAFAGLQRFVTPLAKHLEALPVSIVRPS